jgi:uncharacterized protein
MDLTKFKSLLEEQISFPDYYSFKFIVKTDAKDHLLVHLEEHVIEEKLSSNGSYTSVTSRKLMQSADEVVAVYQRLSTIKGVITL